MSHLRRFRQLYLALAAVLVVAVVAIGSTLGASPAAPTPTWADDFDGPGGAAPDPGKWFQDTGGSGYGNNELERYTGGTYNAVLDGDGRLVITARRENPAGYSWWYGSCQYTSGRLNTAGRFSRQYGRVEARLRIPRGQGLWPAFWTLGDNIGSVGWPGSVRSTLWRLSAASPTRTTAACTDPVARAATR